jgi:hypothetical protein
VIQSYAYQKQQQQQQQQVGEAYFNIGGEAAGFCAHRKNNEKVYRHDIATS